MIQLTLLEVQIHDRLREQFDDIKHLAVLPDTFSGYITLHGEGETDGKRKILFSSANGPARRHYVSNCVIFYQKVIDHFHDRVRRLILHPDSIHSKEPRKTHSYFTTSLVEIYDRPQQISKSVSNRVVEIDKRKSCEQN